MAKHSITNVSDGVRVLNSVPPLTLQPGETTEDVEISEDEIKAFATFGSFEVVKPKSAKAKPEDA